MTKSRGIGRGGARPGSGRKPKAITPRLQALKNALTALSGAVSNFNDADRRFVRAMIALGAPNNVTAGAFGISEVELLAKFPGELQSRPREHGASGLRLLSGLNKASSITENCHLPTG